MEGLPGAGFGPTKGLDPYDSLRDPCKCWQRCVDSIEAEPSLGRLSGLTTKASFHPAVLMQTRRSHDEQDSNNVTRRSFLGTTIGGSAALLTGGLASLFPN